MNTTTLRALVAGALAFAPSACLSPEAERRALLAECTFNDECAPPLLCAARRCRAQCRTDRDCANDWRCLSAGAVDRFVCYAPDDLDTACVWPSHCLRGRVCARDRVCRAQCRTDYDCRTLRADLTCHAATGVCLGHPHLDDGGVLRDVLRNDPGPNVDPVVGAPRPAPDAGAAPDGAADGGAAACAVTAEPGACVPGRPGCDVVDVSIESVTCALFTGGTVRCWSGADAAERYVGNGGTTGCGTPGLVRGLTGVQSIHRAGDAMCVVRPGEATPVWCWGQNYRNQFGRAGGLALVPQATPIPAGALTLGAGYGFSVAASGAVTAWGANEWGQLGDGTVEPEGSTAGVAPHPVSLPGLVQLAAGQETACGVFTGAEVRCWGRGSAGQFGAGAVVSASLRSPTPVAVPGITDAREVALDGTSVCALRADATVWCWGRELFPSGRYRSNTAPRQVVDRAVQAVVGAHHCALRDDATVWCWRYEPMGDERSSRVVLEQVPGLAGVRRLHGGRQSTCAWLGGADLRCWGYGLGVAGAGPAGYSVTPVRIPF